MSPHFLPLETSLRGTAGPASGYFILGRKEPGVRY